MLRVGLTGSLGSGKTTVAAMLRKHGAHIIEADALGREMMEPGQLVYQQIVGHFGSEVVSQDGRLNRAHLAELAFNRGRLNELNAIVHPVVIAAQQRLVEEIFARQSSAVAVLESALIFEVVRDARARSESAPARIPGRSSSSLDLSDWRRRIDRVVVVTAPDDLKVARYAARVSPSPQGRATAEADARTRLKHQIPDAEKAAQADYVLDNSGDLAALQAQVAALWPRLVAESALRGNKSPAGRSLQ